MELNVFSRAWHSLIDQGPKRTLQTALSVCEDYWFDWRYGLATVQVVLLTNLDLPVRREGAIDYQPSRTRFFRNLLKCVNAPPGSVFVDLGAGKGRTLLLAAQHGYRRAVGVELSAELCAIARRNIERFRQRKAVSTQFEVVQADVVEYTLRDDENVIFVSAFGQDTMRRVLRNVAQSLARAPRDMRLVYHNPYAPQVIEEDKSFRRLQEFVYGSNTAVVYANNVDAPSRRRPVLTPTRRV